MINAVNSKSVAMDFGAMFVSSSSSSVSALATGSSSCSSSMPPRINNKRRMPSFSRLRQDHQEDDESFVASPEHFRLRVSKSPTASSSSSSSYYSSIGIESRRLEYSYSPTKPSAKTGFGSLTSSSTVDESNSEANASKMTDNSSDGWRFGTYHLTSKSNSIINNNSNESSSQRQHQQSTSQSQSVPWRLPRDRPLALNEAYLNEQLDLIGSFSYLSAESDPQGSTCDFLQLDALLQQLQQSSSTGSTGSTQLQHLSNQQEVEEEGMDADADADRRLHEHEQKLRQVMDIINGLLFLRQQELNRQTVLSQSLTHSEREINRKQHLIDQLTDKLASCERELCEMTNVMKAKETRFQRERNSLLNEKKQLEKQNTKLLHLDTSYKAQHRRREQEYGKLQQLMKKRLERSSSSGAQGQAQAARGMVMRSSSGTREIVINDETEKRKLQDNQTNQNRRVDGRDQELQMTQRMVHAYERRQADLLFENESLTKSLERLQEEFQKLVVQYQQSTRLFVSLRQVQQDNTAQLQEQQQQQQTENVTVMPMEVEATRLEETLSSVEHLMEIVPPSLPNGAFYDQMQHKLQSLREKIELLSQSLEREIEGKQACSQQQQQPLVHPQEANNAQVVATLREKLQEAMQVVKQQDDMLKTLLFVRPNDHLNERSLEGTQSLDLSWVAMEREQLEHEKSLLEISRANFLRDRKLFDEQAIRLDEQRFELERERHRQVFDDSSTSLETEESQFVTPVKRRPRRHQEEDASPFALPVEATPETKVLLDDIIGVSRLRIEESNERTQLLSPILAEPVKR